MNYASYKHYSFDLWRTLIKSHPDFKATRAKHLKDKYNSLNKSLKEIKHIIRQVDLMCNAINEKTGSNIDAEEMYYMILYQINESADAVQSMDVQSLYYEVEELIDKYTPLIYSEDTIRTLSTIKEKDTVTLNILSNTGFIKGKTLRKVLKKIGIADFFDFQLYSDELGVSKPNRFFFTAMLHHVQIIRTDDLSKDRIIHIGDNFNADIQGALAVGINACHVNTNNQPITTLLK